MPLTKSTLIKTETKDLGNNKFRFWVICEEKNLEYAWYIYKNNERVDIIWYTKNNALEYKFEKNSKYKLRYFVRDKYGNKVSNMFPNLINTMSQYNNDIKNIAYPQIRMAAIMDEITYDCFKYDCNILKISKENYKQEIDNYNPNLLFVESAWHGNDDNWEGIICNARKEIVDLVKYCKLKKITTVYWNKEDPVQYEVFKKSAVLFDYIWITLLF